MNMRENDGKSMVRLAVDEFFWFLNGLLIGAAVATVLIIAVYNLIEDTFAATYNVMFNNVEQGANSTSSPKVIVTNGRASKSNESDAAVAEVESTDVAGTGAVAPFQSPNTPADGSSTVSVPRDALFERSDHRKGRLALLANSLNGRSVEDPGQLGGTLELGYFPLRDFGLKAFAGGSGSATRPFYGAAVEFVPVRLSVFDAKDALEFSGVVGASTLGQGRGEGAAWGSVHAGLGATANFGNRYGITLGAHTNLTDRAQYRYWLANAGLIVRF